MITALKWRVVLRNSTPLNFSALFVFFALLQHSPLGVALERRSEVHSNHQDPETRHQLELREAFKEAYYSKLVYNRNYCGVNIKRLLEFFEARQIPLINSRVLFLLSEKHRYAGGPTMPGPLLPGPNRSFANHWDFHVVLLAGDPNTGKSLVFDLENPRPDPLPVGPYLRSMFPENPERTRWLGIQTVEIDSQAYLKAFETAKGASNTPTTLLEERVVGSFRNARSMGLKIQSLREFMNQEHRFQGQKED
jgi:hypothetical protein